MCVILQLNNKNWLLKYWNFNINNQAQDFLYIFSNDRELDELKAEVPITSKFLIGGTNSMLQDTGERIIPPKNGEVSYLFNRHRMAYLFAIDFVKGKTVLDAGCGTGYGSQILANHASKVYAVDYSYDAIQFANENYAHPNLTYLVMDANYMGFGNDRFDVIVSFQVIEHMKSIDSFLRELIRVNKKDGTIIISTPNVQPKQKKERKR